VHTRAGYVVVQKLETVVHTRAGYVVVQKLEATLRAVETELATAG
jgi:hypothetical protein